MNTELKIIKKRKGFTLLELLIVITIIAVLSVVVIIAINPAETLKKARDVQRISDLSSIKTSIVLYQSSVTTPYLGATGDDDACKAANAYDDAVDLIWYSIPSDGGGVDITDFTNDGNDFNDGFGPDGGQVATANLGLTDATGWIPVNLNSISSGSPISNYPVDPTNSVTTTGTGGGDASTAAILNANALVYRYVCDVTSSNKTFEIDATLESTAYSSDTDSENKDARDGGNAIIMFESGTKLQLLGANSTGTTSAGF